MKKLVMFALAALLVFGLTACGEDGNADGLDNLFVESGSSKLLVNNASGDDLLLFAQSPKEARPIAGVLGGRQGWGVKNAPSGLYVLYVVTRAEYALNKADPKLAMSQLIFVDNEPATYEVSSGSIGNCELVVNNDSNYFVEVRNNSFNGSLFVTVRPQEHASKFLAEGAYYLYPVVKVEKKTAQGQVLGVYSKNFTEGKRMLGLEPGLIKYLNVTPGDIQNTAVECLIYINNNIGGDAEVHAGSADGDLVVSTLGRRLASSSSPFIISRRPDFNAETGQPMTTNFSVAFVLKNFQRTSQVYSANVDIGKSYSITCNADGT